MEKLLHYVWMHKLMPSTVLRTTDGRCVEILDPGQHNNNQGPDFSNARIRLDGMTWAGNVEIHTSSADWTRHGHDQDPVYNTTILHVVERAETEVFMQNGHQVPQVVVGVPQEVKDNYEELLRTTDYPRCHRFVPQIEPIKAHSWFDALLAERMEVRAKRILAILDECRGDWEQTTFITLARNFGFGLNGDIFEMWAKRVPLAAAGKHRDDLFQIESLFLGMAGLIDEVEKQRSGSEVRLLRQEFEFLKHKFGLTDAMERSDWCFMRTRPRNFPYLRILQIAELYHSGKAQMSKLLEAESIESLQECLKAKGMTAASRRLLIINTAVPLLFAYGKHSSNEDICQRAIRLLEALPAENNHILRQWETCGLKVATAADSQALIQLTRNYCEPHDCLRCRFGSEFIRRTPDLLREEES